jgi:hypothetical protein
MRCWRPVSTSFSSSRCAFSSTSAAGASNATRPLVPMMVSPRWMPRPMPKGPRSFERLDHFDRRHRLAVEADGAPWSKWIVCCSGARGL